MSVGSATLHFILLYLISVYREEYSSLQRYLALYYYSCYFDFPQGILNLKVNTTISDRVILLRQPQKLIRINKMLLILDCSCTTLYRWVKSSIFPQPIIRGGRTLGWPEQAYDEWLKEQQS